MKRDLELIRNIMMYLEQNLEYEERIGDYEVWKEFQSEENSVEKVCYHLKLIQEIRWINTVGLRGSKTFDIIGITNDGHDFLDSLRDVKIWEKVKHKLAEIGGYTLSIVVDLGKDYLKKQVGF